MADPQSPILPGDRYVKVENPSVVWVVERLLSLPDMPPHLHLSVEGKSKRIITFSVSALLDGTVFQKVEKDAEPIRATSGSWVAP